VVEDRFVAPNYSDADYIKAYLTTNPATTSNLDNSVDVAALTTFVNTVNSLA